MEINLLNEGYKNNEDIYNDFLNGTINYDKDYFSKEYKIIDTVPDFPIYLANAHVNEFIEAVNILKLHMIYTDRDIHLNGKFWHSYLLVEKRDYIIEKYPQVKNSIKNFNNIVLKKFDWENYIYKCILAAEYIRDEGLYNNIEEEKYAELLYENLDLFNYIIKYPIFRNSEFVMKFFSVIKDENLSSKMKEKIKHRNDLGKDERYGRRVLFELNKNYPIIMSPFLEKEELKNEIYKALRLYEKSS
ncbi:DUF6339 family protein [Staphylococcus saprophyticus]|uniref:Uncharacterized protein n=1 Tax=Staphylococcus saprophyticus TaxID=29385 RepID=A0A380HJ90_STASA|nr:DUF6339 family protein [Staphylococcus saprophyticus]MDW3829200.1 DUF6339 family protein [Staphylococcus saprophyticus]MDW4219136.1 DUF6339 family protein [Staphylococcus saprophyticus]MDW4426193.1 DUF6339 family protein [Staphylococcus saprophyticus]SUM81702.1 Uncharacterised protein [Staphylococcus saprophyticus]